MQALRLLFTCGPGGAWRAGFDLAQAAAALDVPLELGFAGDGLELVRVAVDGRRASVSGAFASLEMLGVEAVRVPAPWPAQASALPIQALAADAWRAWLRAGPLQTW